ncbi:hypothetical protein DI392_11010 [Vibrio albus]|uniref:Putative heavy-metal chelation domain-containing protein n=1 Tax=Vibrio albus TaxID=2200953 RepID=A0A2U3B988_9VIBR|nr:DUF364 domain-containing protein [Vibrio albus]PWI33376.1 hypothetical protein DI392_11010 [Vibrio albus]
MEQSLFFTNLLNKFRNIVKEHDIAGEEVSISGKVLTNEEAIGNPDRKDFPLLTGKERLMQAEFRGFKGQAFSDMPGPFTGTIASILEKEPQNNWERAVFIATMNAVCAYLGIADKTVHCKNNEPEECASQLVAYVKQHYGNAKIALVGLQPSMLEALSGEFMVRNLDLDKDKIGSIKFGVEIEDGFTKKDEVLDWCDIIIATGSTCANGSIVNYLDQKPVLFYGTTVSGAAALMNLPRFCACAG